MRLSRRTNVPSRCMRSCLNCPICATALQLQSLAEHNGNVSTDSKGGKGNLSRDHGPFMLTCPYCAWSTLEQGIKFDKGINTTSQLAKALKQSAAPVENAPKMPANDLLKSHFEGLRDFYNTALAEANPSTSGPGLGSSFGLDSPSHLSRILNQYGIPGLKKQRQKPVPMREAASQSEGLRVERLDLEDDLVERMRKVGWSGTATVEQRAQQFPPPNLTIPPSDIRFINELRPTPIQLRSRRSKRCQQCRYHLVRPDDKRHSARYKLRLLALNYIPRISAAPLNTETASPNVLIPGSTQQFVLTCRNPLYDPVRVKLGTPSTVLDSTGSRITILCPQFDIGASADVWDEALNSSNFESDSTATRGAPEAGKVWRKGRNWTSIVLEVVPGFPGNTPIDPSRATDNNLLEIPILVRMEYFTDSSSTAPAAWESPENSPGYKSVKEERVPKEIVFWVVVGLGRLTGRSVS